MKSIKQRMDEFVAYHINGDGECNTVVLKKWADVHKLDFQQRYELAYFFSITYCVESAIVLFNERGEIEKNVCEWVRKNKQYLIFQSDRKYIRMKDSFEKCLRFFYENIRSADKFFEKVSVDGKIILSRAIPYVEKWTMFGRFSAFLFLEMFVNLIDGEFENTTIDWKRGNTATSGLLNLFGMDNAANSFDKNGKLPDGMTQERMDGLLSSVIDCIQRQGGSTNVTEIETSLCAYRKFYKGSRYNGYYLDRMLDEILSMRSRYRAESDELLEIRSDLFEHKYLGEKHGWSGIRSNMKKLYKESGMIT